MYKIWHSFSLFAKVFGVVCVCVRLFCLLVFDNSRNYTEDVMCVSVRVVIYLNINLLMCTTRSYYRRRCRRRRCCRRRSSNGGSNYCTDSPVLLLLLLLLSSSSSSFWFAIMKMREKQQQNYTETHKHYAENKRKKLNKALRNGRI